MIDFSQGGTPLTAAGIAAAVAALDCAPPSLWALLAVETAGCGFQTDRRPKILFERHLFHRLTNGRFDAAHPDVSNAVPGGYGSGGAHQYDRLAAALALDESAALGAASWGLGQVLGTNYAAAGFATVQAMVTAFVGGEDAQLAGMTRFILAKGLAAAVAGKKWTAYAKAYNGADYALNRYDEKLQLACAQYEMHGTPDVVLRESQVLLNYLGYETAGVDGLLGARTAAALKAFQGKAGLPASGTPDAATLAALRAKVAAAG